MSTGREVLPPVTPPIIHLYGTSREILLQDYHAAFSALLYARRRLEKTEPQIQDYPLEDERYQKAHSEHLDRMKKLDQIRTELFALYKAVDQSA